MQSNKRQMAAARVAEPALRAGAMSPGFSCNPADLQSSHVMRLPVRPATIPVKAAFQSNVTSAAAKSVRKSSNLPSLFGPPTSAPYRVFGLHPLLYNAVQSQGTRDGPHDAARWWGRQGGFVPTPTCENRPQADLVSANSEVSMQLYTAVCSLG